MDLFGRVQLPDPAAALDRYPHQFSSGQRQRLLIAAALACAPRLVIADEPTTALDVTTQQQILRLLRELVDDLGISMLFVTHDLEEAIALADKVVVLTAGPGRVKGTFRVDLPRPRKAQEIRFTDEFTSLYHEIWEALRSEVEAAYARTTARAAS